MPHQQSRAIGMMRLQRPKDREVLCVGCADLAVVVQTQPQSGALRAVRQRIDERGKRRVVCALGNDVVKRDVRVHDGFVIEFVALTHERLDRAKDGCRLGELLARDVQRGAGRSLGLENSAHGVQIVPMLRGLQVDHEAHGREEQARVQRGDVGAVTLSGLEHPHDAERANSLAE